MFPYRSYVLVSRDRIARNYRRVCDAVGPATEVLGVVKANAYGHGAVEVARVLEGAGARTLAVSSVEEGVELRTAGLASRILVMAGILPFEGEALAEFRLTPALASLEDIALVNGFAQRAGRMLPYHLKLDTGMGRLGTRAAAAQIVEAVAAAPHAQLEGLMTHLASPADFTSTQTDQQIAAFRELRQSLCAGGLQVPVAHMASTHAIAYIRDPAGCNMVRPGLALYGYVEAARGPAPPSVLQPEPALSWKARIVVVKELPAGAPVGYGATFRASAPMRIAIVAAGYADGIFHNLSNRGQVIAAGKIVPILGSVCMDVIAVDVTHAPALAPGDEVTLLGEENGVSLDARQIAATAGTIPYTVLCAIGRRVHRVYV